MKEILFGNFKMEKTIYMLGIFPMQYDRDSGKFANIYPKLYFSMRINEKL
jgi:hypothetical protein